MRSMWITSQKKFFFGQWVSWILQEIISKMELEMQEIYQT